MACQLPDPMTARRIIDQLKSGTTPLEAAIYLDVARDRWYRGMQYYFENAEHGESKVRFIRGRYGDGKTHLMAMAQHFALERGFVVSYASAEHTRLDKFEELYRTIVKNLRSQQVVGGIEFLLRKWQEETGQETEAEIERLRSAAGLDINFRIAVESYLRERTAQLQDRVVQWLSGEPIRLPERGIMRYLKAGDSRDMMRSLSIFLRLLGYRGLLVLLDELDRIQFQSDRIRNNCYQVLRELMDNTDGQGGMQGTLFYCAAPQEMFVPGEHATGFPSYAALWSRLEPVQVHQSGHVDYRATIINLDETQLGIAEYCALAARVRDVHGVALAWDAAGAIPDSKVQEIVDETVGQRLNISVPRVLVTAMATIADIEEQGQPYDVAAEIKRAHDTAEQARIERHHQAYKD